MARNEWQAATLRAIEVIVAPFHGEPPLFSSRLRFQTSHLRFCIGFPVALYTVCNAINLDKLSKWFGRGDGLDYLALSAYLLAGLGLFTAFFTLLAHRRTIKPLAILLTITSTAGTYFIAKYGVAIDTSMVQNTVHTDVTEVGQLLSLRPDVFSPDFCQVLAGLQFRAVGFPPALARSIIEKETGKSD